MVLDINGNFFSIIKDKKLFFVFLGIAGGLLLVFITLIESRMDPEKSTNIIAMINGRPIYRTVFESMRTRLNDEREGAGRPLVNPDTVLNRIIEEELLVQRAIELGLPYSDKITRGYLIQNMLNFITKDVSNLSPDRDTLKQFYEARKPQFTKTDRIVVDFLYCIGKDHMSREKAGRIKVAWSSLSDLSSFGADELPIPVPSGWLRLRKLADYVGTEYAEYFFSLKVGEISNVLSYLDGWLIGRVADKESMEPPGFEAVENQALIIYKQVKADEAVNDYLSFLKQSAEIKKYEKP